MSYLILNNFRGLPISTRLTDEVLCDVVGRLPPENQHIILSMLLTYYENHPDVSISDFVKGFRLPVEERQFPFGGGFVDPTTQSGFQVPIDRLPHEILVRIKIYVSLICDF